MEATTQYLQVLEDLRRRKKWGTDVNILRFVALTLASTGRSDLTHRLEGAAKELYDLAGWTSPLRSSIRYVIAAMDDEDHGGEEEAAVEVSFEEVYAAGAVLIDPAAYYGHREADLAMTRLFGGFESRFYDAYHEASPLAPGHEERLPIYQLYHLLNHLNLFGRAYYGQSLRILQRYS